MKIDTHVRMLAGPLGITKGEVNGQPFLYATWNHYLLLHLAGDEVSDFLEVASIIDEDTERGGYHEIMVVRDKEDGRFVVTVGERIAGVLGYQAIKCIEEVCNGSARQVSPLDL